MRSMAEKSVLERSSRPTNSIARAVQAAVVEMIEPRCLLAAPVSGHVFADANSNGRRDAGEAGIGSQIVYADYNYDAKLSAGEPTATTDANGAYTLTVDVKSFALRTAATADQTVVAPAGGVYYYEARNGALVGYGSDFAIHTAGGTVTPPPTTGATVSGFAFNDANGNGKQDTGEAGLSGVTVYADLNYDGTLGANEPSAVTGADGIYTLTTGTHAFALRAVAPNGGVVTSPANNQPYYYEVSGGTVKGYGSTFGVRTTSDTTLQQAVVLVHIDGIDGIDAVLGSNRADETYQRFFDGAYSFWIDSNRDGVLNAGEQLITRNFFPPGGDYRQLSARLAPGTYTVAAAKTNTLGTHAITSADLTVTKGTEVSGVTLHLPVPYPVIWGRMFLDTNSNGMLDANEQVLSAYTGNQPGMVWADYNANGVRDPDEPLANLSFEGVTGEVDYNGIYVLAPAVGRSFALGAAAEFNEVPDVRTTATPTFTLADGAAPVTSDIGFKYETGTLLGVKVALDADGNGSLDATETTGVVGQTVFADYNYNGVLDAGEESAVTNQSGVAWLVVPPKPFQLVLKPTVDYTQTSPGNHGVYYYELNNGVPTGYGTLFGVKPTTATTPSSGRVYAFLTSTAFANADSRLSANATEAYYYFFGSERSVWIDLNHNNVFDANEPTFAWEHTSDFEDPDVPFLTIDSLPLGDYTLAVGKGTGVGTTAAVTKAFSHTAHQNSLGTNVDIVNVAVDPLTPVVVGDLFDDLNANGQHDASDQLRVQYNSGRNLVGVFADYNFNGTQDAGEPSAYAPNDNPEGFSSFNGIYVLRPQAGRAFKVVGSALSSSGKTLTQSTPSPVMTLNNGDSSRVFDLGFADTATPPISPETTITGTVFRDANGNGRRDAGENGEVGLDGVFADTNYNGRLDPDEARAYVNADQSYTLHAPIASFALRPIRDGVVLSGGPVYYYEVRNGKLVGYGTDFALS